MTKKQTSLATELERLEHFKRLVVAAMFSDQELNQRFVLKAAMPLTLCSRSAPVTKAVVPGAGPLRFTNLERTLIDAAVRPGYAGGVFEVRKAYELAKPTLSVKELSAMLTKLAYTYPYHQAIGYYLERAGHSGAALDVLRKLPMELDFYLTHQMSQTDYVKGWRLFVPKGF
jgi:hypothetical protein